MRGIWEIHADSIDCEPTLACDGQSEMQGAF